MSDSKEPKENPATESSEQPPPSAEEVTPPYLTPRMREFPVSNAAYYQKLFVHDHIAGGRPGEGEGLSEIESLLDPYKDAEDPIGLKPMSGVLLTFEQGWYQKGLALGRLIHSLSLAPGEVTKVAVMEWQRQSRGSSRDSADQTEGVTSSTDHDIELRAVQTAVARESAHGASMASNVSSQSQASAGGGGLFFSGSASTALSTSLGLTASATQSSRNLAADASKNINQKTVEASQAVRSRRATQIREVSESESQSATTRVVANYNHMHALTVMYFEVLQIFALTSKVTAAERCVFVPMEQVDFSADTIKKHRELLISIFNEIEQYDLCEAVVHAAEENADYEAKIKAAEAEVAAAQAAYDKIKG